MELVVGSVKKLHEVNGGEPEKKRKRKKEGVDDEDEEEPLVPVEFDLSKITPDDGVNSICWEVRSKLGSFTGDRKKFWQLQPRVLRPLRESFDTDHLRMDPVNASVTLRDHDRGAKRTIKQYSKANIQVTKSKAYFSNVGHESHDVGLVKDYAECTATYQVVSALWQYSWNVWMIRRDDHSGFLMLAVLHHTKFFLPILIHKIREKAARDKKQVEVITYFVNTVMEQNSMRGRQARPPLEYEEMMRVAKSAANMIYSGSGVGMGWDFDVGACQFDPYTAGANPLGDGGVADGGTSGGGGGRKARKRRSQADGLPGARPGAGGQSGGGGQPAGQALLGGGPASSTPLCRDWNKGPCPFPNSCRWLFSLFRSSF